MRSKADETFVIVETLIFALNVSEKYSESETREKIIISMSWSFV